jgi:hypothetical protein
MEFGLKELKLLRHTIVEIANSIICFTIAGWQNRVKFGGLANTNAT